MSDGIRSLEVIQVIKTETCIGKGTPDDVSRIVTEYFTMDGSLLLRQDKWLEKRIREEME